MQRTVAGWVVALVIAGCGSSKDESGFTPSPVDASGVDDAAAASQGDAGSTFNGDAAAVAPIDSGSSSPTTTGPTVPVVYAHSPSQLFRLNPTTKAVTVIGTFGGDCSSDEIIDIALDASSNAYVTGYGGFYKLDLKTAACTLVASGSFPNSLSFVPKGTLDPSEEALVGYDGATYERIDTTSGVITTVGGLSGSYSSSGDIVSVIGGGTFLTVTGDGCGDCLLQVDPKSGAMIQNYGSVNHASVFGLAYWAGTLYGFDDGGDVFSIDVMNGKLVTSAISVPSAPSGLEFWGAGSTTSAPVKSADGGGIPVIM